MNTILFESPINDSQFIMDLYSLVTEDYNIQDTMVKIDHLYNKTQNQEILTEGFSDVVEKVVKFFKTLLQKFKEFFKNVMMYINSYTMELNKFIDKYKDKLKDVNVDFTIKSYRFTIPEGSGCPNLEPYQTLVSNYNSSILDMKSINSEELSKEKNEFLSDANLDKLRGTMLGTKKDIPEDEFVKTVRSYFRDGAEEEVDIEVNGNFINAIVREAAMLDKAKRDALKTQTDIETLLNKTITFFDKKMSVTHKGSTKVMYAKTIDTTDNKFKTQDIDPQHHTEQRQKNVDALLKLKYDQSKQIATMATTIATEKTKALNDCIASFRKILRTVIFNRDQSKGGTNND